MLLITKASTNTLLLTLTEKCTITNPYFLFVFWSDVTKQELSFILADTSIYKYRYNKFTFVEPTTQELEEGYWNYEVYEQSSSTNTDKAQATGLVEQGKLKVVDLTLPIDPSTYEVTQNPTVYS